MRRTLALVAIALVAAVGTEAALPAAEVGGIHVGAETAHAQKPRGNASKIGDNTADLVSDIVTPILLAFVGIAGLIAFQQRSVGALVTMIVLAFFAGFFLMTPGEAESTFLDIYRRIF